MNEDDHNSGTDEELTPQDYIDAVEAALFQEWTKSSAQRKKQLLRAWVVFTVAQKASRIHNVNLNREAELTELKKLSKLDEDQALQLEGLEEDISQGRKTVDKLDVSQLLMEHSAPRLVLDQAWKGLVFSLPVALASLVSGALVSFLPCLCFNFLLAPLCGLAVLSNMQLFAIGAVGALLIGALLLAGTFMGAVFNQLRFKYRLERQLERSVNSSEVRTAMQSLQTFVDEDCTQKLNISSLGLQNMFGKMITKVKDQREGLSHPKLSRKMMANLKMMLTLSVVGAVAGGIGALALGMSLPAAGFAMATFAIGSLIGSAALLLIYHVADCIHHARQEKSGPVMVLYNK